MRRRINGLNGRDIFISFLKILAASSAMSAAAYASYYFLHSRLGAASFVMALVEVFIPITIGGIIFVAFAKLLRVTEIEKLYSIFSRKLGRSN